MVTWHKLGAHRYHRDGDVVFMELHGDFQRDDAHEIWNVAEGIERECGYALIVFDAREGLSVSPEARQYLNKRKHQRSVCGAVLIVGASFGLRTIVLLLQHAGRLLTNKPQIPLFFCATLEELPALIETQRPIFAAKQKGQTSATPEQRDPL